MQNCGFAGGAGSAYEEERQLQKWVSTAAPWTGGNSQPRVLLPVVWAAGMGEFNRGSRIGYLFVDVVVSAVDTDIEHLEVLPKAAPSLPVL